MLVISPVTLLWIAMATRQSPPSGDGFDKFRRRCVGELDWSRVAIPLLLHFTFWTGEVALCLHESTVTSISVRGQIKEKLGL